MLKKPCGINEKDDKNEQLAKIRHTMKSSDNTFTSISTVLEVHWGDGELAVREAPDILRDLKRLSEKYSSIIIDTGKRE